MSEKKKGITKYFSISLAQPEKWTAIDYLNFLFENIYQIIMPFFIGLLIGKSDQVWWIFFLIFPIYVKFQFSREATPRRKKKIYFK